MNRRIRRGMQSQQRVTEIQGQLVIERFVLVLIYVSRGLSPDGSLLVGLDKLGFGLLLTFGRRFLFFYVDWEGHKIGVGFNDLLNPVRLGELRGIFF